MAEPASTSGISIVAVSVAILGPTLGPYSAIAFAALAGSTWPLSGSKTLSRIDGFLLMLRCTLMAIVLTVFIAGVIDKLWAIPAIEVLAPVAFIIGAMGNGWRPVFSSIGAALSAFVGRAGTKNES